MKPTKQARRQQSGQKATKPKANKPAPIILPPEAGAAGVGKSATTKPQSTAGGNWLEAWERRKAELDSLAKEDPGKACDAIPGRELSLALFAFSKVLEHHGYDTRGHGGPAMSGLLYHTDKFLKEVENLARDGSPEAQSFVWRTASRLCWLVEEIARTKPEDLRSVARISMFMPSLRALPPKFMADWKGVADNLELSKSCVVNMRKEAQHELHSPVTLFVARWLERAHRTRLKIADASARWKQFRQPHTATAILVQDGINQGRVVWRSPDPESVKYPIQTLNQEDFIRAACHLQDWQQSYLELPMLYNCETQREWFEKAFKPYVYKGPALTHIQGTRLHDDILRAKGDHADDGTYTAKDYIVRDELVRRCRDKFKSLAPSVEYSRQVAGFPVEPPPV